MSVYQIAFAGNPNVGKSAWINALSNADFQIGNWPGVTVERKEAICHWHDDEYHLIDLPGCYSLTKACSEERITSDFLQLEHVDVIVNVVDATNLAHNLLLTLYLRELQIPMILIFNFMDEAEKQQMRFDFQKLSRRLQIPILPYSAFDQAHTIDVKEAIEKQVHEQPFYYPLYTNEDVERYVELFQCLEKRVPAFLKIKEHELHRICMRLFYREEEAMRQVDAWHIARDEIETILQGLSVDELEQHRYHTIQSLMQYVHQSEDGRYVLTNKIDRIALHPYLGMPIFFLLFTLLLLFVFQVSTPWNEVIVSFIQILSKYVLAALFWAPDFLKRLICDGILAGVGGVLSFIPLMLLLYMMLSILEESGYMSRIAFLLDRMMKGVHLSGKSFVSFMLGFGCNVPAIYATRTLDNEKQRKLTALLVPFMSCGARMPIYVLFASAFFPHKAGLMIITVYGIGIFMAVLIAYLFSKTKGYKEDRVFVLELPPYRMPRWKVVRHKAVLEVKGYVKKATGIVLWAMVVLWALSYFPNGNVQSSYLSTAAKTAAPIFEPLGFGNRWESVASLPGGIIAKETILGFFEQVLQPPVVEEESLSLVKDMKMLGKHIGTAMHDTIFFIPANISLQAPSDTNVQGIASLWQDRLAPLRAFSFMVYVLLSIPCIMTLQALYHEYGWKLTALSISFMIIIPYAISLTIFQILSRIL